MNTKTAEEKPDFKTMASQYNNSDVSLHDWIKDGSHRGAHAQNILNYTKGCERIWDDYVAPLKKENENLKSCMIAAAEEIMKVWPSHCDDEGYGPSNLMHRLEKGIPAQYGYKAGDFEVLKKRIEELEAALQKIQNPIRFFQEECIRDGMILDGAMAVALSKDPVYLQEIARKALNPSTNGKQD